MIARVDQYIQGIGLNAGNVTTTVGATQSVPVGGQCINVRPVTVSYDHTFIFLGGIGGYFGSTFGTKTLSATASMRTETGAAACP